jgi:acetyl-CoA C-acetyltransferase
VREGEGITRADQDAFAAESYRRALRAQAEGKFKARSSRRGRRSARGRPRRRRRRGAGRGDIEKLAALRPAFQKDGTVTAGNASSINDGAAALVLASADAAAEAAGSRSRASSARPATRRRPSGSPRARRRDRALLARVGWKQGRRRPLGDQRGLRGRLVANNRMLGLDPARVNVWGGAVALGHPIGASGARVLVTLLWPRSRRGQAAGVASLCIGGGEGIALASELDVSDRPMTAADHA